MPAYILIDNTSGYIWSDTRNINGKSINCENATEAARITDQSLGVYDREYTEHNAYYATASDEGAYHVYRVDIEGSKAIPVVMDGQDQNTINSVIENCDKIAVVTFKFKDD